MEMSWSSLLITGATVALAIVLLRKMLSHGPPLPPGPKPLPFIGSLAQIPHDKPYKVYQEWSQIYGPVIYFHVFGRKFIILNTLKSITDLFEKRSSKYSTRPRYVMGGELIGREETAILFMKYGQKWKHGRQIMHRWLSARNIEGYTPFQYESSCRLMKKLCDHPENLSEHLKMNVGSVILRITYGIECKPHNDPWIAMADQMTSITAIASQPGRWIVDSFPFLRYMPSFLPGAGFIRWARLSRQIVFEHIRLPFEQVKEQTMKGSPATCFVGELLAEDGSNLKGSAEQHALACAAASLYAGGIDTIVSTLRVFFLSMLTYPDIQRRAQGEIDAIIGAQRLATIDDRVSLPFIGCLIKEVLRFSSPAHLVPHGVEDDDIYEGYRIPKGAVIMANLWAVLHDPHIYPDPFTFNPERFMGINPQLDPSPISFAIGLGRRFCPGSHFALSVIFLNITHALSIFNIMPPLDSNGQEYIPPMAFIDTHTRKLAPFRCRIVPRERDRLDLVENVLKNLGQV